MLRSVLAPGRFQFKIWRGRFAEEINAEILLEDRRVAYAKLFFGRPPHYGQWAELFAIEVFNTPVEEELYCHFHRHMEPGDILYVEYVGDRETFIQLQRGTPPEETRLGKLLRRCGFTNLRNWYHPEGGLEGAMKIQAVRP